MDIDHDIQTSEEYSENQIGQSITNKATSNNEGEGEESDKKEVKPHQTNRL